MKKRLKNILTKSSKKNGLLLFRCVICCTLLSGMLIGCSAIKNDSPEESVQIDLDTISQSSEDSNNSQTDGSSTDISSDTQNETIENPPEQPLGLEENSYKSILLGNIYENGYQVRLFLLVHTCRR